MGEIRRRKGLSQEQLSAALGVSRSFISHVERGAKSPPYGLVDQLVCALRLSADERAQLMDQAQCSRRHVSLGRSFPACQVDLVNRLVRGMRHLRRDQIKVLQVIVEALPTN